MTMPKRTCGNCGMPYPPEPPPLRYFKTLGLGEIEVRHDGWGELRPRRGWFWSWIWTPRKRKEGA